MLANGFSLNFDGVDDYVTLGQPSLLNFTPTVNAFSFSIWFKTTSASGISVLLYKGRASGSHGQYGITYDGNGGSPAGTAKLTVTLGTSGTQLTKSNTGITFNDGVWHNIVVIAPASTSGNVVIDGTTIKTVSLNNSTDNVDLLIGARRNSNNTDVTRFFQGNLDELAFWDEAITTTEATAIYNNTVPIDLKTDSGNYASSANLIGWWRMGDADDDDPMNSPILSDASGNGNIGTMINMDPETDYEEDAPGAANTLQLGAGSIVFSGKIPTITVIGISSLAIGTGQVTFTGHEPTIVVSGYFVDWNNGSDSNAGTFGSPFKTIQKAATLVTAGQTVYIRGGTYVESFIRFTNSGTETNYIALEGWQDEEVILDTNSGAQWFFDFTDEQTAQTPGMGYYLFRKFKAGNPNNTSSSSRHIWRFSFDDGAAKPHHIVIENCVGTNYASAVAARRGGVAFITIRNCDFSGARGTEGSLDFGNNTDDYNAPQSGSHDILIEDTDLHDNFHNQQCNGMVTQASVYNVTIRRCRVWNNAKYGLALKGSGNIKVDRCVIWGNGSSHLYTRGMVSSDPASRTADAYNNHLITNCILIGPRDSSGGTWVWREHTNVQMYNCTVVCFRDENLTTSGHPWSIGERWFPPRLPIRADVKNCIFMTYDGQIIWFLQSTNYKFLENRTFYGDRNLYYKFGGGSAALFRYQSKQWSSFTTWKNYWADGGDPDITGDPGDDGLNGPAATHADANSSFADPKFSFVETDITTVPIGKRRPEDDPDGTSGWPTDYTIYFDPSLQVTSPAIGAGENLTSLGIEELMTDFSGKPRPTSGSWDLGALQFGSTPEDLIIAPDTIASTWTVHNPTLVLGSNVKLNAPLIQTKWTVNTPTLRNINIGGIVLSVAYIETKWTVHTPDLIRTGDTPDRPSTDYFTLTRSTPTQTGYVPYLITLTCGGFSHLGYTHIATEWNIASADTMTSQNDLSFNITTDSGGPDTRYENVIRGNLTSLTLLYPLISRTRLQYRVRFQSSTEAWSEWSLYKRFRPLSDLRQGRTLEDIP